MLRNFDGSQLHNASAIQEGAGELVLVPLAFSNAPYCSLSKLPLTI